MKILLSGLCFFFVFSSYGQVNPNYHNVKKYIRKDGTQIQSHKRTNPNHTNRDNYTTYPNVNPHTGIRGYIASDKNEGAMDFDEMQYYADQLDIMIEDYNKMNKILENNSKQWEYDWENGGREEWEKKEEEKWGTFELSDNLISYDINIDSYENPQRKFDIAIRYHNIYSFEDRLYLEQLLKDVNLFNGTVDGVFTNTTINSIKELQRRLNVSVDGKFGNETINAIDRL